MNVTFSDGQSRLDSEIDALERSLGIVLPRDYRAFLRQHDGARPSDNRFAIGNDNIGSINRFIPLHSIKQQTELLDHVPLSRLAFAWSEGGNFVCLETGTKGGVFFWDHELPTVEHRIAAGFGQFLSILQPVTTNEQGAQRGVKRAWINPDLLRKHGK